MVQHRFLGPVREVPMVRRVMRSQPMEQLQQVPQAWLIV